MGFYDAKGYWREYDEGFYDFNGDWGKLLVVHTMMPKAILEVRVTAFMMQKEIMYYQVSLSMISKASDTHQF